MDELLIKTEEMVRKAHKAIGNYGYKIINKGFDDYIIIGKEKL